ncbi:MAG: PrsW family glutamic-type intramembrane protease, partial [Anaerolineales bacterium]
IRNTEYGIRYNRNMQSNQPIHWPSVLQFGLSALAALLLWGSAGLMLLLGMGQLLRAGSLQDADPSSFLMAAGFGLLGNLFAPSAWYSLARLVQRPVHIPPWTAWRNFGKAIWLMPLVFLLGRFAAITPALTWLALPILHVLAIGVPVLWFLSLGGRGLKSASPQSAWGVFGAGLALGPFIIVIAELLLGLIALVIILFVLADQPGFRAELQRIVALLNRPSPDPRVLLPFLEAHFIQPSVILIGLLFTAGVVPVLEEFFKPIGLIFLSKRALTPARGFLAGMLSGAAFALFESLFQAVPGEGWVILVTGRMGTSLVHIFNSGLVGWGFALARSERRYLSLLLHYLIAVTIHALWNGMAVLAVVASLPAEQAILSNFPWAAVAGAGLLLLGGITFLALVRINQHLQRQQTARLVDPGSVNVDTQSEHIMAARKPGIFQK